MAKETIRARVMEDGEPVAEAAVEYDFGDNLQDAIAKFGEDVIFQRFRAAATVDLQGLVRRHLSGEKPKTQKEIEALVADWKPGVATKTRKSKEERVLEQFEGMSDEERKALIARLTGDTGNSKAGKAAKA